MKNKILVSLLVVTIMICAMFAVGEVGAVSADITASSLFGRVTGSVTVESVDENGVDVVLGKSSSQDSTVSNSFSYKPEIMTEKFGFSSHMGLNFSEVKMIITDAVDSAYFITIVVTKVDAGEGAFNYDVSSTISNKEYISERIPATLTDDMLTFDFLMEKGSQGYVLTLNGVSLNITDEIAFVENRATLTFEVDGTDSTANQIVRFTSLTNSVGSQALILNSDIIAPIIVVEDGLVATKRAQNEVTVVNDTEVVTEVYDVKRESFDGNNQPVYSNAITAKNEYYKFPVVAYSLIGEVFESASANEVKGLTVEIYKGATQEGSNEITWTKINVSVYNKYLMTEETYKIVFTINADNYVGLTNNVRYELIVDAIEDEFAPKFNEDKVREYFYKNIGNLQKFTSDSKTGLFPSMKEGSDYIEELFMFGEQYSYNSTEKEDDWDGIDGIDTITVYIGYKSPTNTEWTFVNSSNTININAEGKWYFTYKVIDASSNETIYKDGQEGFYIFVTDDTPPVITPTKNSTITVNENYTIATPSMTDVGVGINNATLTIRLFKGDKDGEHEEIPLTKSYMIPTEYIPTEITPEGEEYSYFVEYTVCDYNGNKAVEYNYLKVVNAREDSQPNTEEDETDWLFISLIAIAGVLVVVIVLMLFVKPKDEKYVSNAKYKTKK